MSDPSQDIVPAAAPTTADLVEMLNAETREDAARILGGLPAAEAVDALDQPQFEAAADVVALLPRARAAALLTDMADDRATDLLRDMEEADRAEIMAAIAPEIQASLKVLLTYPRGTAAGMMTTEYVWVPEAATVSETLAHIRKVERTRETIYAIYVLSARRTLVAAVPLRRLIAAEPYELVAGLAKRHDPITVSPETDREEVASIISRHDLLAVPVVDRVGHLLGIVTVDDVIDAIVAESTEDIQKFGGVDVSKEPYLQTGFGQAIRKRAGWLSILFISEMLTASAMQYFQDELQRAMVLTLFIPLIMSSGGNSGSQATSLLIRALALDQVRLKDWWRVALRELPTGLVLGALLGLLGVARIAVWQLCGFFDYGPHWPLVATTVCLGLIGIVTFGSLAGSMLPFLLQRVGFDPASASAPFVATLVDVTGLIIYFGVAFMVLSGTML